MSVLRERGASPEEGPSGASLNSETRGTRPAMVELRAVSKSFGSVAAVRDVSLSVGDGEFFTILGPSGSGKTTVLRIIAGLLAEDAGEVFIGGVSMRGIPSFERELAMVFQWLALFPHMTVTENIAFPLRMRRTSRAETAKAVRGVLELMQLPDIGHRRINELSGGQRQRVALARSLVYGPRLLLLDEPLTGLDRRLREDMQLELTRLHREVGVTIVNVTHDQQEALFMSDRVAVMNDGRVIQTGQGRDIYDRPASEFVAAFLGDPLLVAGGVIRDGGTLWFEKDGLRLQVPADAEVGPAVVVLRPECLRLLPADTDATIWDNALPGEVTFASFDGTGEFVEVALEGGLTVRVHTTMRDGLQVGRGDRVIVAWNVSEAAVLPGEVV